MSPFSSNRSLSVYNDGNLGPAASPALAEQWKATQLDLIITYLSEFKSRQKRIDAVFGSKDFSESFGRLQSLRASCQQHLYHYQKALEQQRVNLMQLSDYMKQLDQFKTNYQNIVHTELLADIYVE